MAIAINSKELLTLLEVTPSWQNIMLTGRHGIGKSQILTKYFESKGMRVVALFLGQMSDPGDLLGLPNKDQVVPCLKAVVLSRLVTMVMSIS